MVSCVICYEKLGEASPSDPKLTSPRNGASHVSATDCGHLFHTSCITKWMASGRSRILCPICKHSISPRRLTTIYQDWSPEPGQPAAKCKDSAPSTSSTSSNPPAEESRLKTSFTVLNDTCLALRKELAECYAQLKSQTELTLEAQASCQVLNSRLAESTADRERLELLVTTQNSEKEKLAERLARYEKQRNLDAQKILRQQLTLNQFKGLELIASLGTDNHPANSAVEAFLKTGPQQQLRLFKALEAKSHKLLKERHQYFLLYENSKKHLDVTSKLLEAATQQNLEYEKQMSSNSPIKKGARAPPVSYSPPPKEPRVKLANPFLRERNSNNGKYQEPEPSNGSSSKSVDASWSCINPRKRPRSPSNLQPQPSLGDHFDSLSLNSVIDLTNEEVTNSPLKTKKSGEIEIKPIRRNIHGFFT